MVGYYGIRKFGKTGAMSVNDLKKELVTYIQNVEDEELLQLLKEDFLFYSKTKDIDIVNSLNKEQLSELQDLAAEEDSTNSHDLNDFRKATDRWRSK